MLRLELDLSETEIEKLLGCTVPVSVNSGV
jgi:hypothetical protein